MNCQYNSGLKMTVFFMCTKFCIVGIFFLNKRSKKLFMWLEAFSAISGITSLNSYVFYYFTWCEKFSADEEIWHFKNPDYLGASFRTSFDSFKEGSSHQFLSIHVKVSLNFEGNFDQKEHRKQALVLLTSPVSHPFYKVTKLSCSKIVHTAFCK